MEGENGKTGPGNPQPGGPQTVTAPVPQTPTSYTPEEATKLVSDALAEQGRKHTLVLRPITAERDTLKSQLGLKDGEITDNAAVLAELNTRIDDLTSDDPQRYTLVKEASRLRVLDGQLKTDRRILDAEKLTHAADRKLTDDTRREITVMEIATGKKDAEGKVIGDPERLKEVCEKWGATTEEQIQEVADTLWPGAVTTAVQALKILSGATSGGATDFSGLSPEEKVNRGLAKLKKQ